MPITDHSKTPREFPLTHAIFTVPPHEEPYALYLASETDNISDALLVVQFQPCDFDKETRAALELTIELAGFAVSDRWVYEIEYWIAPVVLIR